MKKILLLVFSLLTVITLFYACKKDNKYDELTHLAAIKLQEAIKFAENQPCKPVEEWRIDTISNRYVAVHPSFEREYIKLINEYKKLFEQAIKAYRPDKKEGLVYDTTPIELYPHFGVRCKEGNMIVLLAEDLDLVEINQRLEMLFPKVRDFFKDTPCTDASKWYIITLLKDCEFVPIAITNTPNFRTFEEMERQYRSLNAAKVLLTKGMDCPSVNPNPSQGIVCVNGKASVKL
ncbi:hypothetical protein GEO21_20255 [Sphingobacterium faecium]|uniref:hypothetical protein n=1 Tax=Sphingobacterium faecium TaxID=34087 RepID=UPI001290B081|nr:hypothetical protein [Sphingobacterium faecium]MQP29822.1 hypothetical protein [Sphingobacterium faecium]